MEAVTQEPDWGDIGGAFAGGDVPPDLGDSPFEEYVPKRPPPTPRPAPIPVQAAAPARPGDIRAHPLYEEIKGRFSGRVREIGKNRRAPAPETGSSETGNDDDAPDA